VNLLPRPRHELPRSRAGMRWYSEADLAELRRLVEASGYAVGQKGARGRLKTLLDDLPGLPREPSRKPLWAGGDVSPRPRQFLARRDQDFETERVPPNERRQIGEQHPEPIPPPVCCPRCGVEVTWIMQAVPGATDIQAPWCEGCGPVNLEEPPAPDPNLCPSCQSTITWEVGDGRGGFVPVCPVHGSVEVHEPKADPREERPFVHPVSFNLPPAPPRRGGLTERDVIGAVRWSRPAPGPKILFVDPHSGPTRPS
jgi:hypothetical protein